MSAAFDLKLSDLQARFRARAAAQALALEVLAEDLERGTPPALVQAEIKRIAHSLAGGGGTFGFSGISACAAELEEFLTDCPESPQLSAACRALVLEIGRAI